MLIDKMEMNRNKKNQQQQQQLKRICVRNMHF